MFQLHESQIRDVCFLNGSWPWARGHQTSILTAGYEGSIKICTLDGRVLHSFHAGHCVNTVCPTPETFNHCAEDGFYSKSIFKNDFNLVSGKICVTYF